MKTIYYDKDIPRILMTKAAAKCCKPLLFTGINAVKYKKDLPDAPLPADNWVRVRNRLTGICGTDISFFLSTPGTSSALEPIPGSDRTYLGHETVGVVEEVGPAVTRFKPGDRVTLMAYMASCLNKGIEPPCEFCRRGDYCLCENYGEPSPLDLPFTGAGFGDTYLAPETQLCKVRDELTDEQAVLIEPAAVCLHAVLLAPPKPGEKVLVLGGGLIGLGIVQCLKKLYPNCHVTLLDRNRHKQEMALKLGADGILKGDKYEATKELTGARLYHGMMKNRMLIGGFDRIYDCIGTPWATHDGLRMLKARGTFVKVGHHMRGTKFDETPLWWQELTVIGVDSHGMETWEGEKISTFDLVQKLMAEGVYETEGFVTHTYPLDDYKKAFKLILNKTPGVLKVVLDCR